MPENSARVSPFDILGGNNGVLRLVDRFYDIMERDDDLHPLRAMHSADLRPMRARLREFLSGWLGGPRLYDNCVRSAHAHFLIGAEARDQWLVCMSRAMNEADVPEKLRELLTPAFTRMADMMRNA
jgi:hemoglobin